MTQHLFIKLLINKQNQVLLTGACKNMSSKNKLST